jgi:hypothetical protein
MPPMPIRPPPWCRTFSDPYLSQATLELGMGPHCFDPHINAHKHCILLPSHRLLRLVFSDARRMTDSLPGNCATGARLPLTASPVSGSVEIISRHAFRCWKRPLSRCLVLSLRVPATVYGHDGVSTESILLQSASPALHASTVLRRGWTEPVDRKRLLDRGERSREATQRPGLWGRLYGRIVRPLAQLNHQWRRGSRRAKLPSRRRHEHKPHDRG